MKKLNSIEEFYECVESKEKIVVYWYTKWCPDCFMVLPFLGKLEKDFPTYKFYKIDRDSNLDLARHLEIYGIPSFLVYNDGDETGRLVNKLRKSYLEIKSFLDKTTI